MFENKRVTDALFSVGNEHKDRIAELEAERDAERLKSMALADLLMRAQATGIWSDAYDAKECRRLKDDFAKIDPAAILAARDARMKREGALEELKRLPKDAASYLLFPTGLYAQGWNAYKDRVVAAINALGKEARSDG